MNRIQKIAFMALLVALFAGFGIPQIRRAYLKHRAVTLVQQYVESKWKEEFVLDTVHVFRDGEVQVDFFTRNAKYTANDGKSDPEFAIVLPDGKMKDGQPWSYYGQ